ncbi:MAG: hypothetical protein GY899_06795 [Verrucomicrobiaceae bacterium]|nr:hypothetical protein [Verrucomicrobiaceae bacterium]
MKIINAIFAVFTSTGVIVSGEGKTVSGNLKLREVIVSHADDNGILQLYRMKENGTDRRQLTYSKHGCRMPSCSPDRNKLAYIEQIDHSLTLRIADLNGQNSRTLVKEGMNLMPSWTPDSRQLVWMKVRPQPKQDPARNSQIHILTVDTGQTRRLFTDQGQLKFSNAMPVVSPSGDRIAFVSNRSGNMRIWVSDINGSNGKMISSSGTEFNKELKAPVEQKVPAWSPNGKWIAHWEGVEMIHMSRFTGIANPNRDRMIAATFHVWVVGSDGKNRRKVGRGDDPSWSPDGFVSRAFPDPQRGGPKVMVETKSGEKQLPIVPHKKNWGRFTWIP